MSLNTQQRAVYAIAVYQRESLYFGGDAGTGKTHLARAVIDGLAGEVCVCAPTGQAAQLLDGFTVHQMFGLIPPKEGYGPATRRQKWRLMEDLVAATAVLVDECSMLSQQMFEDMNRQAQRAKKDASRPFGGLQVIFLGDFLQLPPVGDPTTADGRFCFASPLFGELFGARMFRLTEQMRQGEDARFAAALSRLRRGECPSDVVSMLRSRLVSGAAAPSARTTTHLFCLRADAERCNSASLAELPSLATRWTAIDWFASEECRRLAGSLPLEPEVELKVGAPVLLIRNMDLSRRLVNGTRGVVTGIYTLCELGIGVPCNDPETCDVCAERSPLHHEQLELLGELPPRGWNRRLPVVDFGGVGRRFIVGPITVVKQRPGRRRRAARTMADAATASSSKRKQDDLDAAVASAPPGEPLAKRVQMPLILGFGLTIHKAQGMTLDRVCISWNKTFESGQAYVALSRCPTLGGVSIASSHVPVERIRAAPDALAFEQRVMREPPTSSSISSAVLAAAVE